MRTYERQLEDAKKKCHEMRDRYHEEFERIFDETMESDDVNYIFSMTGSVEVSKEKFDSVLQKIKNPKVAENAFDTWIKRLEIINWKVESDDEKYVFCKLN